jgi:hypothetical protein
VRASHPGARTRILGEPLAALHGGTMSHTTDWTCRSCRTVLGQVRDGVLWPLVPVESVDGRGAARLVCPGCGRVRAWEPAGDGRPIHAPPRPFRRYPSSRCRAWTNVRR